MSEIEKNHVSNREDVSRREDVEEDLFSRMKGSDRSQRSNRRMRLGKYNSKHKNIKSTYCYNNRRVDTIAPKKIKVILILMKTLGAV